MKRASIGLFALLILIGCTSDQTQPSTRSSLNTSPTPSPGPVDIGGYSLWMDCQGAGSPVVILEAGLGDGSSSWESVQPELATSTKVCSYDRASIGTSDPRPSSVGPVSGGTTVEELHKLLATAGIRPPYVIVGHSFGGMLARIFATMYPKQVGGIVLVDSSSEEQLHGRFGRMLRSKGPWVELGTRYDLRATERLLTGADLGARPLVVLTHGRAVVGIPPWAERLWAQFQTDLTSLSTDSVHVLANHSQHYIQDDQPDLVIEAVRQVVSAVASGHPLGACGSAFHALGGSCLSR